MREAECGRLITAPTRVAVSSHPPQADISRLADSSLHLPCHPRGSVATEGSGQIRSRMTARHIASVSLISRALRISLFPPLSQHTLTGDVKKGRTSKKRKNIESTMVSISVTRRTKVGKTQEIEFFQKISFLLRGKIHPRRTPVRLTGGCLPVPAVFSYPLRCF